jgi:hypothetical protein
MVAVLGASVLSIGRARHLLSTAANGTIMIGGGCAAPRFHTVMLNADCPEEQGLYTAKVSFGTCLARRGEEAERCWCCPCCGLLRPPLPPLSVSAPAGGPLPLPVQHLRGCRREPTHCGQEAVDLERAPQQPSPPVSSGQGNDKDICRETSTPPPVRAPWLQCLSGVWHHQLHQLQPLPISCLLLLSNPIKLLK